MRLSSIVYVLVLSAVAFSQQEFEPAVDPLSTAANQCWTSGSGATYFKVCISQHGNVVTLKSPANKEHIAVGQIMEGYLACAKPTANGATVAYYDAANNESGWAEPYQVTTAPPRVKRRTTDGRLELVQDFLRDSAEYDLTVTMTLYNRAGQSLYDVRLDRYVDFDINNTWLSDEFHRSPRSVFGWEAGMLVSLTNLSTLTSATAIHSGGGGFGIDVCNAPSVGSPTVPGDWIGRLSFNFGTMAAGASRTVKLLYRVQ